MTQKTPADRKHDFLTIGLTFLLTTVLGGFVTFYFGGRSAERGVAERRAEADRVEAKALFDRLSSSLDRRLYLWYQTASSLEEGRPRSSVIELFGSYLTAAHEWQSGWNGDRARLCLYFGGALASQYEHEIIVGLHAIHDSLESRIRKPDKSYRSTLIRAPLREMAAPIALTIRDFNNRLIDGLATQAPEDVPCADLPRPAAFDSLGLMFMDTTTTRHD